MYSIERPNLKIPLNWKDKTIILIATIPLIFTIAYLKMVWRDIPEVIPTHFGFSGTPDAFGGKNSLFILIGIYVVIHILLCLLSKVPKYYNYPVPVNENTAEALYKVGRQLMLIIDLEISILLSTASWQNIQGALGKRYGVTSAIIFIIIGVIFLTVIYALVRMMKVQNSKL